MKDDKQQNERDINQALMELDWDIQPERDLWPDISSNIRFAKRKPLLSHRWAPAAMAACVTFAVMTIMFSFNSYQQSQRDQQLQATLAVFQQSQIQLIEQQHQVVRAQLSMLLVNEHDQLSPQFVVELRNIMSTIDQASSELKVAMKAQPNNSNLASMLANTYQTETKLLNQLRANQNLSI